MSTALIFPVSPGRSAGAPRHSRAHKPQSCPVPSPLYRSENAPIILRMLSQLSPLPSPPTSYPTHNHPLSPSLPSRIPAPAELRCPPPARTSPFFPTATPSSYEGTYIVKRLYVTVSVPVFLWCDGPVLYCLCVLFFIAFSIRVSG